MNTVSVARENVANGLEQVRCRDGLDRIWQCRWPVTRSVRDLRRRDFDHNHEGPRSQRNSLLLVQDCTTSAASILPDSDGPGARLEHIDPVQSKVQQSALLRAGDVAAGRPSHQSLKSPNL